MSGAPTVSVCIPVYNPGSYLRPAVDSVLAQDFTDFELIVVDDASNPPALSTLDGLGDSRIRLFRNPANLGLVGNWNRCLELARGRYLAIFHQDDVMRHDNLSLKAALLEANPSAGMVYSNISRIDQEGRVIAGHWTEQPGVDTVMKGCTLYALVARQGNPVSCPSVMVRAECYKELGCFDPRLAFAVDLEMWLRIASRYDVGYFAQRLICQRQHPTQETARFAGSGRDYEDVLKALEIAFSADLPTDCARHASEAYRTLSRQARAMARWKLRQTHFRSSARYLSVAAKAVLSAVSEQRRSKEVACASSS